MRIPTLITIILMTCFIGTLSYADKTEDNKDNKKIKAKLIKCERALESYAYVDQYVEHPEQLAIDTLKELRGE